jgi:prophage DNA circulation protein
LLAEVKSGQTTHEEAVLIFERAFDYGMKQLLEEGVLDILKKIPGVEKATQLVGKVAEKVAAAWKRVSDFYLDFTLKAVQLLNQGIEKFSATFAPIINSIDAIYKRHPVFCKLVICTLIAAIGWALFGSAEALAAGGAEVAATAAQAGIDPEKVTKGTLKAGIGALQMIAESPATPIKLKAALMESQVAIQEIITSGDFDKVKALPDMAQEAIQQAHGILDAYDAAAPGEQKTEYAETFLKWRDLADKLKLGRGFR